MYFPPSQIKTNLYTSGKELSYASNGDEYVGFYFKTSSGRYYSGKNPNNPPNVLLTTAVPLETFELDVEINNPIRNIVGTPTNKRLATNPKLVVSI